MKPEYIKRFEKLGFGIFVHFGLYSLIEKGVEVFALKVGIFRLLKNGTS